MLAGPSSPELRFGAVLLGLLAAMWALGRTSRSEGRPIGSGRALVLATVYAVMFASFVAPPPFTAALLALIGLGAADEIRRAFSTAGEKRFGFATLFVQMATAIALPWLLLAGKTAPEWVARGFVVLIFLNVVSFWIRGPRARQAASLSVSGLTVLALDTFCLLRTEPRGAALCLYAFFLINVSDTAAFFCGKFFGRHKLAPAISPKKTIEGSLGSIGVTIAIAFLFVRNLALELSTAQVVVSALLLNVLGQAGDLLASLLKRKLGLKDFSARLGGHGGVLDRFDSCLLAVPAFLVWTFLIR